MVAHVTEPSLHTQTHAQVWHQSMALNEVWKTGQRGLPVFINSLNAIQMLHASPVPTKSAHVSAKWQNIASLKWYTLTEARTSVRTTSAAARWLWYGIKMSAPVPVFIVHFTVFAWVPSQWKWEISLYFYLCLATGDQLFNVLLIDLTWLDRDTQEGTHWPTHCYVNMEEGEQKMRRRQRTLWKALGLNCTNIFLFFLGKCRLPPHRQCL